MFALRAVLLTAEVPLASFRIISRMAGYKARHLIRQVDAPFLHSSAIEIRLAMPVGLKQRLAPDHPPGVSSLMQC